MKKINVLLLLLIVSATHICFSQVPAFVTDSLDAFMHREMERWQIPGAAVAIVKDGKILVSKGYGVSNIKTGAAVDESTLFMVASNSKAFTGTAIALLEEEGKLELDDPVKKYLPWLNLYDDCATEMVTIKDMLTHRIGWQTFQGDFLHWGSDLSRKDLLERMDVHQPQYNFRDGYGYCNMGFVAAGEIIPAVSGKTWDDFVADNIFKPLHMDRSSATYEAILNDRNACKGYTLHNGALMVEPYENIDNLGPAASINSCVKDLAQWVMMNSQEGRLGSQQIFSNAVIERTTSPFNIVSETRGGLYEKQHFELYGLGWFMADYNGKKMVWHDGGANGFVTTTCFLPEMDLGIVVLTNTDANWFYEALKMQIIESFMEMPYRNISAIYNNYFNNRQQQEAKETEMLYAKARSGGAAPTLPLKAYTGNYRSSVYGMINISEVDGKLRVTFEHHPDLYGELEPLGENDEFVCTYNQVIYGVKKVQFKVANEGVVQYQMHVADFIDRMEYTFDRISK